VNLHGIGILRQILNLELHSHAGVGLGELGVRGRISLRVDQLRVGFPLGGRADGATGETHGADDQKRGHI
jgi:hypothetical protein